MGSSATHLELARPQDGAEGALLRSASTPRSSAAGTCRQPLVAPVVAFVVGVAISRLAGLELMETLPACGAQVALAVAAWRLGSRRLARVGLFTATAFAGMAWECWRRPPPPPTIDFQPREILLLSGCVVEAPIFFEDRTQFVLELERDARARVTLNLREGQAPPALRYGDKVELEARLRLPRNFHNEGSFDYVTYLARRHTYWLASTPTGTPVRKIGEACASPLRGALYAVREWMLGRIDRLYAADPYAQAVWRAMLVGEGSRLDRIWAEQFRRTGSYHALVISGMHLTAIAAVVLFLLRLLPAGAGVRLSLAAGLGWLYALMVGAEPPVLRAAAGLTLFLTARYFYRQPRLLNLLAATALAFLLWDPGQLFEASFQLSFLAVALIGGLALPFLERFIDPYARGLRALAETSLDLRLEPRVAQFRIELRLLAETLRLMLGCPAPWSLALMGAVGRAMLLAAGMALVSGILQLGMALPSVIYFHRVPLTGVAANLTVVTLLTFLVPVGFAAIVSGWSPLVWLGTYGLNQARRMTEWFAAVEPDWRVPDPPWWLAGLLLCTVAGVIFHPRVWTASACAAAVAVMLWHPFPPRVDAGKLELTTLDTGQSESHLLVLPDGKTMLIDGGGIPPFAGRRKPRLDIGEDVVSPYLWSRSFRRLDVVVASHAHEDHAGGLAAVVENFRPAELWTSHRPEDEVWRRLEQAARRHGVRIVLLRRGARFSRGGADWVVLAPPREAELGRYAANNDSLVLELRYGRHRFLFTGDIERSVERELVEGQWLSRTLVLKVPHHGSRSSSSAAFLAALQPAFAVISAGYENVYRFPHPDVLQRLRDGGAMILRTDRDGRVTIRSDGNRVWVSTWRWQAPVHHAPGRLAPAY